MRFWDSSALVPLFVSQRESARIRGLYASDPDVLAWTLSDVEIRSALARLVRDCAMAETDARAAARAVEEFWGGIHTVSLVEAVKPRAKRLLDVHALGAADAMQLGAALAALFDQPLGTPFVCLDERLATAARREGFTVVP